MRKLTPKSSKPKPLKVTCTSSDCGSNLHCFKKSREMAESELGNCRSCGADLIDWKRVHRRDVEDAAFVFNSLKYEMIRHLYWHLPIDLRAENHARRKGILKLREFAVKRLTKYLVPDYAYDGRQTPTEGNIVYYAQHALACCCRTCLEYWHGIPKTAELTSEDINYFANLIMLYVNERLPNLTQAGEKVPPIRQMTKLQ